MNTSETDGYKIAKKAQERRNERKERTIENSDLVAANISLHEANTANRREGFAGLWKFACTTV